MNCLDKFADITRRDELLAPYTWLKLGGPAQYFLEPRSVEELCEVVKCCQENDIPLHVLGDGSNLLIRDEGVSGAVVRLSAGGFADVSVDGTQVKAGAGAALSHVISRSVAAGLTGLEDLAEFREPLAAPSLAMPAVAAANSAQKLLPLKWSRIAARWKPSPRT